jgi:caa(3)-type oxidase subunit IV
MASAHQADAHAHGPNVAAYFTVFGALAIFTGLSFVANLMERDGYFGKQIAFGIILGIAVIKAVLVGMIFMHLKWDWGRLFFMIIPAFIIATMMIIVFLPDMVLAWHTVTPQTQTGPEHPGAG